MADPKLTAIMKLQQLAAQGQPQAIELLQSLGMPLQGGGVPPIQNGPFQGGNPFRGISPNVVTPAPGPNPFAGRSPNLGRPDVQAFEEWQRSMRPQGNPAIQEAIRSARAKPVGSNMGQRLLTSGNPGQNMPVPGGGSGLPSNVPQRPTIDINVPQQAEPKLLTGAKAGGRLGRILGMLGQGAGAGLMGASAYGVARDLAGPQAASYLGGPGMQVAELVNLMRDNTPDLPQGPGMQTGKGIEALSPEYADALTQTMPMARSRNRGSGGGRKQEVNPFTFNDPTEMGPELPEEMAETNDGFPEEILERTGRGGPTDFSMAGRSIVPQDPAEDPSLALAAKKNKGNPLMRAIMGIGKGLGKVF